MFFVGCSPLACLDNSLPIPVSLYKARTAYKCSVDYPDMEIFAPNPVHADYEMFYRDRNEQGEMTQFKIVPIKRDRKFIDALFNPGARRGKVVSDCVRTFTNIYNKGKDNTLLDSYPYLVLRQFINTFPTENNFYERQFIIVRIADIFNKTTEPETKVIFTSPFQQQ